MNRDILLKLVKINH